jgi:hypothetical protein
MRDPGSIPRARFLSQNRVSKPEVTGAGQGVWITFFSCKPQLPLVCVEQTPITGFCRGSINRWYIAPVSPACPNWTWSVNCHSNNRGWTRPGLHLKNHTQGGYFCETGILLLALSRYIGDPNVIDHCGLIWGGLQPEPSLGRHADNVIIPLDLTQLFCPTFMLAAGPPSSFTTDIVGCWGGALWRACNLTAFIYSSTGPVVHPCASRHGVPGFNPQRGTYVGVVSLQKDLFLFLLVRTKRLGTRFYQRFL